MKQFPGETHGSYTPRAESAVCGEDFMQRQYVMLLLSATGLVILGGALFLNLFHNEPLWTEWMLGPFVVCAGLVMAIVGITLHCYSREFERSQGLNKAVPAAGGK